MFKVYAQNNMKVLAAGALVTLATLLPLGVAQAQDDPGLLIPMDHPAAPFLESRAYAASVGATNEFRKMEWVAVDPVNSRIYWAMSEVSKGMSDGEGAVNVEENLCGIVYAGDLDADNNVTAISPLLVGGPYNADAEVNRCDVNNIANPDNLVVDSKGNLWIGEDTSNHENNVIWMYDGTTLKRFGTVPLGGEATGLRITADDTLFFNSQHPSARNVYPFNRGLVGVVNGYKAGDAFEPLAVPEGRAQQEINVAAGTYQVLARAGEAIPQEPGNLSFGQVLQADGSTQVICNHPDGNMFLPTAEDGSEGYLYTNYECEPGGVNKIYIRNNGESWDVIEGENLDFSAVMGTWTNCGANVTPWNTGMTAEEYEPIAAVDGWQENVASMTAFLGTQANPYDYGYEVELIPDTSGDGIGTKIEKRYAMGRFSHENSVVTPDLKTVYFGDDGTDVVFFKFVADEPGVLSAGTLYAAKVTQNPDASFTLDWIELGKGNDEEIAETIRTLELPQ